MLEGNSKHLIFQSFFALSQDDKLNAKHSLPPDCFSFAEQTKLAFVSTNPPPLRPSPLPPPPLPVKVYDSAAANLVRIAIRVNSRVDTIRFDNSEMAYA